MTGEVLSAAQLHRMAADYVPHLSEEGAYVAETFELMDGKVSLAEIAHRLARRIPSALLQVGASLIVRWWISQEYSR